MNGIIELKDVGQIIQYLLDGTGHKHRFVNEPVYMIDENETKRILLETDDYGNVILIWKLE